MSDALPSATCAPLVRATALKLTLPFGNTQLHILNGISFDVYRGEWIILMGPSGSGKSTLLGLVAGIDTPTAGQLVLDGIDITRLDERHLARIRNQKIGVVFQSFNLLPGLTAQENVEMPLYVRFGRRHARNRAREMLHLVGLDQVEILSAQIQTVAPEALVVQSSDISNVRQRALQNLFIFVVAVTSFAFIAAVVLITNMVSLTLAERRREFAIQKAVGFSRGQVLIMLVLEYALLGLTAAGGAIGALVVTTALINTLQPSAQLVFPPELSLLIATITIATAALSAILVTWRTVHVPPLEALREH